MNQTKRLEFCKMRPVPKLKLKPQGPLKPIIYFSVDTCPTEIRDLFGQEQLIIGMDKLSLLVRTVCLLPGFFAPLLALRCSEHAVMWSMFQSNASVNYESICRSLAYR